MVPKRPYDERLSAFVDTNPANIKKPTYDPDKATELLDKLRQAIPPGGLKFIPENLMDLPADIYVALSRFLRSTSPINLRRTDFIGPAKLLLSKLEIRYNDKLETIPNIESLLRFLAETNEVLMEKYFDHVQELLGEAFEKACRTDADRERLLRHVLQEIGFPNASVSLKATAIGKDSTPAQQLPAAAPALWLDRENRKETPPEFIKREYAPWLGHGLTQAHILHLDKPLYTALHKWLGSNAMPDWLDLPTKKQMNDRQIQEYRQKRSADGMSARDYLRLRSAAARRSYG
jgi:hypothetical protein